MNPRSSCCSSSKSTRRREYASAALVCPHFITNKNGLSGSPAVLGPSGGRPWLLGGSEDPWLCVAAFRRLCLYRCGLVAPMSADNNPNPHRQPVGDLAGSRNVRFGSLAGSNAFAACCYRGGFWTAFPTCSYHARGGSGLMVMNSGQSQRHSTQLSDHRIRGMCKLSVSRREGD